jgi:hypothetical protein
MFRIDSKLCFGLGLILKKPLFNIFETFQNKCNIILLKIEMLRADDLCSETRHSGFRFKPLLTYLPI